MHMDTKKIFNHLLSCQEDLESLQLSSQDIKLFYKLKWLDTKKLSLQNLLAKAQVYQVQSLYYFDETQFYFLFNPITSDKYKKYFDPLQLKIGHFDEKWLEEFYQNVVRHLALVDELGWEEILLELKRLQCLTPEGVEVNKIFQEYIFEILVKRPSPMRELELKMQLGKQECEKYLGQLKSRGIVNTKSTYVIKDDQSVSSQGLKGITQAGEILTPHTSDEELLEILDDLEE